LGVWNVCCMYRDLSEKGAIVDRLDLKFQSRMWLQRHNRNNSRNPNKMPLPLARRSNTLVIGVWDVSLEYRNQWLEDQIHLPLECGMWVWNTGINRKRSAIVDKKVELCWICHEFRKIQRF
jgi:hypothetical protein